MKVKSESEVGSVVSDSSDPMDCSLPGSFIHGIFQARVLEWGAIAFSGHIASSYLLIYLLTYHVSIFYVSTNVQFNNIFLCLFNHWLKNAFLKPELYI